MSFSILVNSTKPMVDEHLKLTELFANNTNPRKVCLFSNILRDDFGKIYTFPVIEECLKQIHKENLEGITQFGAFGGMEEFCKHACKFLLGENCRAIKENRCFGVQTISSIGALKLGAQFLREKLNFTNYCTVIPDCRGIYNNIFSDAGFEKEYALGMYDNESAFPFKRFILDLEHIPEKTVVVLQMCFGLDPNLAEWDRIAYIVSTKRLFVFFDATFQGLVSGNIEVDAYPARFFEQIGLEFFVAQDFSFNMGLVSERPGNLCVVQKSSASVYNTKMDLFEYLRLCCISPPLFGAYVVYKILSNEDLNQMFHENLKYVKRRNTLTRNSFFCNLRFLTHSHELMKYEHQHGLFINIRLSEAEVQTLRNKHNIYISNSGLICVAGLNSANLVYVCHRIYEVLCEHDHFKQGRSSSLDNKQRRQPKIKKRSILKNRVAKNVILLN